MIFLLFIFIGIVAGFVAVKFIKCGEFGLIANMLVGIAGALLGGTIFKILGLYLGSGFIGSIITATGSAIVFLWILTFAKKY